MSAHEHGVSSASSRDVRAFIIFMYIYICMMKHAASVPWRAAVPRSRRTHQARSGCCRGGRGRCLGPCEPAACGADTACGRYRVRYPGGVLCLPSAEGRNESTMACTKNCQSSSHVMAHHVWPKPQILTLKTSNIELETQSTRMKLPFLCIRNSCASCASAATMKRFRRCLAACGRCRRTPRA